MDPNDVAAIAADDDFDVADDLAAAFDAAEAADKPSAEIEEAAAEVAERVRDDKGRFAPKAEETPDAPVEPIKTGKEQVAVAQGTPVTPVAPVADAADALRPPPGWSPAAKVAFANLPPEVQQSVAKREQEVNQGFAKLAEYKPIERWSEMARNSGTTLDKALENYVGMENRLRQDFPGGVVELCQRQGIHPVALANQILARSGVAPSEAQAGDTPQVHQQAPSVDYATTQRIAALEHHIQQQQTAGVQSEIERFASDAKHTFFENVKADMGRLINSGYADNLDDAYEKACWANPEIRPLLIKQQSPVSDASAKAAAATQARAASKSITGSPIPKAGSKGPETSLEDEIRQLMDASV
jgi:hypothetical protein